MIFVATTFKPTGKVKAFKLLNVAGAYWAGIRTADAPKDLWNCISEKVRVR